MSFEPIPKAVTHERYADRALQKLPGDVLQACDEVRAAKQEINSLRHQVLAWKIKNAVLMALVGGAAAKGIEVAVIALIKLFAR